MMSFISIIYYIAIAAEFIPIYSGLRVRDKLDRTLYILFTYLSVAFLTDVALLFLSLYRFNNLWIIRLFTPFEFALLMLVFYRWFQHRIERTVVLGSMSMFLVFALLDIIAWKNPEGFNTISKSASAIMLVIVSSYMLIRLRLSNLETLLTNPKMWITVAILLHFGVATVVYGASTTLLTLPPTLAAVAWAAKAVANAVSSVLFAKGFQCLRNR